MHIFKRIYGFYVLTFTTTAKLIGNSCMMSDSSASWNRLDFCFLNFLWSPSSCRGYAVAQSVEALRRKVAGAIHDDVTRNFH